MQSEHARYTIIDWIIIIGLGLAFWGMVGVAMLRNW